MQTITESYALIQPLDAMYLVHKALRAEAERAEEAVAQLAVGGSFKPFHRVFYSWAMALSFLMDAEAKYVTPLVSETSCPLDQGDGQQRLMEMLENLQIYLHEDLGRTIVIPRTQRQLRGKVIALHLLQDDLLEDEEEIVLPHLRKGMSEEQQLALMQHLLHDEDAEEAGALLDWVVQEATEAEQQWLAALGERLSCMA
jgi:hypothetical protein